MTRFSSVAPAARIEALLDAGSFAPLGGVDGGASVIAGAGRVKGVPVWVAATDPSRARGALGVAEGEVLCALFQRARREPHPVLLLLDSAGAKVDEGLSALGAFRRLFREALLTRVAGVPMRAMLGKVCFGGSSMLAALCCSRVYSAQTLFGVSGPAVIEALGGAAELDAANREEVRALFGGEARSRWDGDEQLCDDNTEAFRARAEEWVDRAGIAALGSIDQHRTLGQRLDASGLRSEPSSLHSVSQAFQALLPAAYAPAARGTVSLALPAAGSAKPAFLGVLTGAGIGAEACWTLADALLALHRSNPVSPVVLLLDASGHATTRRDEAVMLSAYLVHLSLVIAELAAQGHRVSLWIPGAAAGAVYVAFAAPADSVSALPSAQLRILPLDAVRQIVRGGQDEEADSQKLIRVGVIDAVLDSRVAAYATAADSSPP